MKRHLRTTLRKRGAYGVFLIMALVVSLILPIQIQAQADCTITADGSVCADTSGHIASVPSGPDLTYDWRIVGGTIDAGAGTDTIEYSAGSGSSLTLSVTVTEPGHDPSNCNKEVTINPRPDCTIIVSPVEDGCPPGSDNCYTATVPDAGPGASYVWAISATYGLIHEAPPRTRIIHFTANEGVTEIYIVVRVTNQYGCESTCCLWFDLEQPGCELTAPEGVCRDSTGHDASVVPVPGATYLWDVQGGGITSGQGTTSIKFYATAQPPDDITITVVVSTDCSVQCSVIVDVYDEPDCTITAPPLVCEATGGYVASVPDAGVGASYLWGIMNGTIDSGQDTNSIGFTVTGTAPDVVSLNVTVTDGSGCWAYCEETIDIDTCECPIDCTITAPNTVCEGDTGLVASVADPGGGATFAWSLTNGTIDTGHDTNSITWTADTGVISATLEVTVTIPDDCEKTCDKVVTVEPCGPCDIDCTITVPEPVYAGATGVTASVPDAGPSAIYVWSLSGGEITSGPPPRTNTIVWDVYPETTVAVILVRIEDGEGCEESCCLEVEIVGEPPECAITAPDGVCEDSTGNSASVIGSGGTAPYSYSWSVTGGPGTITAGADTDAITFSAGSGPGTIDFEVTVTDTNERVNICTVAVDVYEAPGCVIDAPDGVCEDTTGNSASVGGSGGAAPYSYSWSVTGGPGSITAGADTGTVAFSAGSGPDTIDFEVTVTDENGCSTTCPLSVTVYESPGCIIDAPDGVCEDSTDNGATVSGSGGTGPYSYSWLVTGGPGSITAGADTDAVTFSAGSGPDTIDFEVTVTDANGCSSTCTVSLDVYEEPDCTIDAPDDVVEASQGNIATVADAGQGATYDWSITGGIIDSGQNTPGISFSVTAEPAAEAIQLSVIITDGNGCVNTCTVYLDVLQAYHTVEIPLYTGWNLISLPVIPESLAVEDVLAPILSEVSDIYGVLTFDAATQTWSSCVPYLGGWVGDLTVMNENLGYWVYVETECALTLTGMLPELPYDVMLYSGWNLVGFPLGEVALDIQAVFGSCIDSIDPVFGVLRYDASVPKWESSIPVAGPDPTWVGEFGVVDGRWGYWVFLTGQCNLSVGG